MNKPTVTPGKLALVLAPLALLALLGLGLADTS